MGPQTGPKGVQGGSKGGPRGGGPPDPKFPENFPGNFPIFGKFAIFADLVPEPPILGRDKIYPRSLGGHLSHPGPKQWSIGAPGPDFAFFTRIFGAGGGRQGGALGGRPAGEGGPPAGEGGEKRTELFLADPVSRKKSCPFFRPQKKPLLGRQRVP